MSTSQSLIFDIFAIDRASAVFDRVGAKAEGMGTAGERGGKMLNAALLGAGAVMIDLGVHAVAAAGNFQASMERLVTTAGETPKNLHLVTAGIEQMAGQVGVSVGDLATAMYQVESGGFHGAQGLTVLKDAAEAARIEGSNTTDVAHALAGALNDYRGSSLTAAEATNAMTSAVGHGMMTFQDLAEAMPNIGARAAAAHVTFEEMLAALATMTKDGLPASKAATYLGQSIGQLAAPTAKARAEMESLGINATAVAATITSGSGHGLSDAIDMLYQGIQNHLVGAGLLSSAAMHEMASSTTGYQKVLADLPPTVQTSIQALATMAGGVRSFQGVLMLGGQHAKQYADNLQAVTDQVKKGGTQVAGFSDIQDTFNQKLADAKGAASALAVEFGTSLLPEANAVLGGISDVIGFLSAHQAVVLDFGIAVTTAAGAFVVLKGASLAWAAIQGTIEAAQVAGTFLSLAMDVTSASEAFTLMGMAIEATPLGAVAAGVGALVGGFLLLKNSFESGNAASAAFNKAMDQVNQSTGPNESHIQSLASTYDRLTGAITKSTLVSVEGDLERSGALAAAQKMGISELTLAQAALGHAGSIRIVNQALAEQRAKSDAAAAAAERLLDANRRELGIDIMGQKDAGGDGLYQRYEALVGKSTELSNAITLVGKAYGNEKTTVHDSSTEWKNQALAISATSGALKDVAHQADFANQPLVTSQAQVAKLAIAFHLSAAQIQTVMRDEMVKGTVDGVQQIMASLDKVGHYHFDLSNVIASWTTGVNQWQNTAVSQMDSMGANITASLANSIADTDSAAATAVANMVHRMVRAGNEAALIRSPSRVFRDMGGHMIEGLVLGINDTAPTASKAAAEAVKKAAEAAHKAEMTALHLQELQLGYALSDTKSALSEINKQITAAQQWSQSFTHNMFTASLTTPVTTQMLNIGGMQVRAQTGGGALPSNATPAQMLASMLAYEKAQAAQSAELNKDIQELKKKGISAALLDSLKGSGPDSMAEINALANASTAQIKQFNQLEARSQTALYNAGAEATTGKSYSHLIKERNQDMRQEAVIKRALKGIRFEITNGGKTLRVVG